MGRDYATRSIWVIQKCIRTNVSTYEYSTSDMNGADVKSGRKAQIDQKIHVVRPTCHLPSAGNAVQLGQKEGDGVPLYCTVLYGVIHTRIPTMFSRSQTTTSPTIL